MKVCIVTPEFPLEASRGRGGVSTYSETLAKALLSRGVEVHVAVYSDRPMAANPPARIPVQTHGISLPWVRYFSEFFPGFWQSVRLWRFLRGLDRQHHFDVFEMYNDEGITLFPVLFFRRRTVFRMHSSIRQHIAHKGEAFNRHRNFIVRLDRMAARSALHLVTHSRFHASEMASEYGLALPRIRVIPHCTPPAAVGSSDGIPPVVAYIGSLDRRKGIDVFLEAAPLILEAIPAARMVVVGRDTGASKDLSWARWFKEKFGPDQRLEFTGPVSDEELAARWETIGILVVPSRYESFGLTVIEGFSRRKAVVTTRAAALPEVAQDGAAFVEAGDSRELAEMVTKLLQDPSRALAIAELGYRTYLNSYTPDLFADRVLGMYSQVIRAGQAAG